MVDVAKIQAQAALIQDFKAVEFAMHLVDRALQESAHILAVRAEDDALSERSIDQVLSKDESVPVFNALKTALASRLASIEAQLGE